MRTLNATIMTVALLAGSAIGVAAQEDGQPTTTDELLSGMVTEEVEPGVYRVINDGVRDLDPGGIDYLHVGPDGNIWTFGAGGFYRLGEEQFDDTKSGDKLPPHDDFGVGPDGTLWVDGTHWDAGPWEGLGSFDGEGWTRHRPEGLPADHRPWGLHVTPDGSVWVLLAGRGQWQSRTALLARLDDDSWEVTDFMPGALPELFGGDSSSVWAVGDSALPTLNRFDGSRWQQQETPAGFPGGWNLVVGPNDTLWTRLWRGEMVDFGSPRTAMAHYDGAEWQRWDEGYFPSEGDANLLWALEPMAAGPGGSLWGQVRWGSWVSPFSPDWSEPECDGTARFDGATVSRYLRGLCVGTLDVAPDGSVWLLASESAAGDKVFSTNSQPWHLFVITPEAVAATE